MKVLIALLIVISQDEVPTVRAQVDWGEVFHPRAYPPEAALRQVSGTVRFSISVGADGRVTTCDVTATSGSQELDEGTCEILRQARFNPARNAAGEPVADRVRQRVTWRQPPFVPREVQPLQSYISYSDYPPEAIRRGEQGTVEFDLYVSVEGRVTACYVTSSDAGEILDQASCRIMMTRARFSPARDAQGNPVPEVVRSRMRWQILD